MKMTRTIPQRQIGSAQGMDKIPLRFPTNMADRLYFCMRGVNTGYFHIILTLNGRIDENRLARTARLVADTEPLLGCQFVDHWFRPYWERRKDLDEVEFVKLEPANDLQEQLNRITEESSDPSSGFQFKVFVLRAKADTLCIRMNHMIGDGSAGKDLMYLLASIYSRLGQDPDFAPKPNLGFDRSYAGIGRQLKLKDKLNILGNLRWPMRELQKAGVTWQLPLNSTGPERSDTLHLTLPPKRTQSIAHQAGKHRASVNLFLTTAFVRALASVVPHPPYALLPIVITVDLRRYLPSKRTDVLCNHSSAEVLFVRSRPDISFEEILAQLREQYRRLKNSYMGLSSILLILETFPVIKAVRFLPFHLIKKVFASRANPLSGVSSAAGLTNAGEIDSEKCRFGDLESLDFSAATPLFRVPGAMGVLATSFKNSITLNMHYFENWLPGDIARGILDRMDQELRF